MYKHFFKRIIGFTGALLGVLLLSPIFIVVTIWLHFSNKGAGAFFYQERVGKGEKPFKIIKFKSMTDEKDAEGNLLPDAERLTKAGKFVRSTSIDELPQFFNVLIGNMSVVGPRPHMLRHTEIYGKLIDKYMVRHFYKPGITGHAQVTGFRGETRELWQMEERIKRDIWYIENWSIWLDLSIIWRTVLTIFVHDKHAY